MPRYYGYRTYYADSPGGELAALSEPGRTRVTGALRVLSRDGSLPETTRDLAARLEMGLPAGEAWPEPGPEITPG